MRVSYYRESTLSRDHTEECSQGMGAKISTDENGFINIYPLKIHLNL